MLLPDKALVWVDLETTGSDVKRDEIIEISVVITKVDPQLTEVEEYTRLIEPTNPNWYNNMSAFVTRMHSDNGLLAELKEQGGLRAQAVDDQLNVIIGNLGISNHRDAMLAGSGVGHFDSKFLEKYLPRFRGRLSYPVLDVGSVRRTLKLAGSPLVLRDSGSDNRSHRANDDIKHHIEEMRTYLRAFDGFKGVYQATSG